jgi:hypothetical protein
MKRTTLFLPEELERDLYGLARREGKPVASCVREALAEYVASRRGAARLPSFVGVGAGAATDVAERHEDLLWTDPHGAPAAPRGRRRRAPGKKR